MASAELCTPSRNPAMLVALWKDDKPPRGRLAIFTPMPIAYMSKSSVYVLSFDNIHRLIRYGRLISDFSLSGQCLPPASFRFHLVVALLAVHLVIPPPKAPS